MSQKISPYNTRTRLIPGPINATRRDDGRIEVHVEMFTESPRCSVGQIQIVADDVADFQRQFEADVDALFEGLAGRSFPMPANN